jgi:glucose/arabinose dehydrogenase
VLGGGLALNMTARNFVAAWCLVGVFGSVFGQTTKTDEASPPPSGVPGSWPADFPPAAIPVDPRRPGVPYDQLPKNPVPVRAEGDVGASWPVMIAGEEHRIEVWSVRRPHITTMKFLPTGEMLITERRGHVRMLRDGVDVQAESLYTVPDVYFEGDNGLMSLCLHPDFASNGWVYIYYGDRANTDCRIVRLRLDRSETTLKLVEPTVILNDIPIHQYHSAGIIRFGPDGKLYASTGDCWNMEQAQNPRSLGGKFLRLNDDGSAPGDNPFSGQKGHRPELFALGTRNAQGMDWQPGSGRMFTTEHGPSGEKIRAPTVGSDEFNLVTPGSNLGWPVIHSEYTKHGMVSPLILFKNTVAPGSGMFYTGTATPRLTGNYFVGCLRGHALMRIELDGDKVVDWSSVFADLGRIRALAQGPKDFGRPELFGSDNVVLYFASSNTDRYGSKGPLEDRIFRIVKR